MQDVYIKASDNLHQLKSQGSLSSWLFRIAHNTIIEHYRQRRDFDPLPRDLVHEESDMAEQAHQEVAQCLRPLIDELPEQYRTPLILAESCLMKLFCVADVDEVTLNIGFSNHK